LRGLIEMPRSEVLSLGLNRSQFFLLFSLFSGAVVLSGCGSASSSSSNSFEQPANFNLTPSNIIVEAGQSVQFSATGSGGGNAGSPSWKVNGVVGGSPDTGTIDATGVYTAPATVPTKMVAVTMTNLEGLTTSPAFVSFFSDKNFTGVVSTSNNPLVAAYTVPVPFGSTIQVQFGTTTGYGLTTWAQPASTAGSTTVLVAGMRASTTYHMQAMIKLASGRQVVDADHTFMTGSIPASILPTLTVPQPALAGAAGGVEMLSIFNQRNPTGLLQAVVTDLAGTVIWYYPLGPGEVPFPLKPIPNGNILFVVSGAKSEDIREVDLAGNIKFQLTRDQITAGLEATGSTLTAGNLHHDILKLANGHYIILFNYQPKQPDGSLSPIIGDGLIDWDPVKNAPVWTWSSFDHLSTSRAPYDPDDWTHANAVIYSPDDGNLIMSMRNQNWVLKINYKDGAGDGSILWHLGPDGDFTMPTGQAPLEFNYGQHYPTIVTSNSAGIFQMMLFNNGNNRLVDASNNVCGTPGFIACYSSVPIYELNESAKTAQVVWETNIPPHYSICCGDALILENGNVEYDVAFDVTTPNQSFIQEVTREQNPQLLWQMNLVGQILYRGFRIPSLYPGVEWPQTAIATANTLAAERK
jgi:arylsulfate sulfotransferase